MSVNARKAQTWMAEQWRVIREQWIVLALFGVIIVLIWTAVLLPIAWLHRMVVVGGLLGILTFSWWYSLITRQTRHRLLRDRERLSLETIYATTFAATGVRKETVAEIWQTIARSLRVDPGQLRPSDSLQWLSTIPSWCDSWDSIISDTRKIDTLYGDYIDLAPEPLPDPITLFDVVMLVAREKEGE